MLHFEPQTVIVTDNKNRSHPIEALVAFFDEDDRPVGLAVHPVYTLGPGPVAIHPGEYTVSHLQSGVRLHRDPVPTEAIARRWLELIASLTDWTQTEQELRPLDTVRLQVWVARVQAKWEEDDETEWDVFTPLIPTAPVSPTFSLDALTALIEWMSHGMEYVTLPREAIPALHTLLAIHADVAQQQRTPALEGGRP